MSKTFWLLLLVAIIGGWIWMAQTGKTPQPKVIGNDLIKVDNLVADQQVTSPLTVTGEARGTWYFEASFPVELKDGNGITLDTAVAQAGSDWMTESFVPFSVTLTFAPPTTTTGTLILHKDNPSGEAVNDDSLSIPVTF